MRREFEPFKPGFKMMTFGWTFILHEGHQVELQHPTHTDRAKLVGKDPVMGPVMEYENAEKVPGHVRTAVKILVRKSMARELQNQKA